MIVGCAFEADVVDEEHRPEKKAPSIRSHLNRTTELSSIGMSDSSAPRHARHFDRLGAGRLVLAREIPSTSSNLKQDRRKLQEKFHNLSPLNDTELAW